MMLAEVILKLERFKFPVRHVNIDLDIILNKIFDILDQFAYPQIEILIFFLETKALSMRNHKQKKS